MELNKLRIDCALKQKKGIHFIMASVFIWSAILVVQLLDLPVMFKGMLVFCCTAPLMPLALLFSKLLKIDFSNKSNPLTKLGIIFTLNQLIYLLIAMWVYVAVPKMLVMVFCMIFGAHLLPYGWLYQSKSYYVMAVFIPITALITGIYFAPYVLPALMILIEIIFCLLLYRETKKMTESNSITTTDEACVASVRE